MTDYQPQPGDRVRVRRYLPDGTLKFDKTGTILAVDSCGYLFDDDLYGRRYMAGNRDLALHMPGWSQTIAPLTD